MQAMILNICQAIIGEINLQSMGKTVNLISTRILCFIGMYIILKDNVVEYMKFRILSYCNVHGSEALVFQS